MQGISGVQLASLLQKMKAALEILKHVLSHTTVW